MSSDAEVLRSSGINPSAQRIAVARYVLHTQDHPTADEVWTQVRKHFPFVSRATIYNTLNLFVEKGLLQRFAFKGTQVSFDPNIEQHHHFIDEKTGKVYDIPWNAIEVPPLHGLNDFEIKSFQIVLRGTTTKP